MTRRKGRGTQRRRGRRPTAVSRDHAPVRESALNLRRSWSVSSLPRAESASSVFASGRQASSRPSRSSSRKDSSPLCAPEMRDPGEVKAIVAGLNVGSEDEQIAVGTKASTPVNPAKPVVSAGDVPRTPEQRRRAPGTPVTHTPSVGAGRGASSSPSAPPS